MKIKFSNQLQCHIADLLWKTENLEDAMVLAKRFGPDGRVVLDMILAASLDDLVQDDVSLAKCVLFDFKL